MIIDFHSHFTLHKLEYQEAYWRSQSHVAYHYRTARMAPDRSLEEMARDRVDVSDDPDGVKLLARMDRAGIDVTVIFSNDRAYEGLDDEAIMAEQAACAGLANRYPGRLVAFASIAPTRKNAPQLLRRCIEEYGMKGLKWHPFHGFDPTTPEAYAVLGVLQEYGLPMLVHSGSLYSSGYLKYSHPLVLDRIAVDFPRLKIVAAHMSHLLWRDWAAVAFYRPNVYGDLGLWQFLAVGHYEWFCRTLREILDLVGVDRVLFASDGPWVEMVVGNDRWVRILRELPRNPPRGIEFSVDEVAAILGGNAQRILKLQ